MVETAQETYRSTQDLSHEDLQKLLAYHGNQSYRQAQRERSAQLACHVVWCRNTLEKVSHAAFHWIAALAARAGLLSRGR